MSTRDDALYEDRIEADGRVLIYEGHDRPRSRDGPDPKSVDQPMHTDAGNLTQNGRFFRAAAEHRENSSPPDRVRVYEKVRQGIWVFNGVFDLVDAWTEPSGPREVFKFRLELTDEVAPLDRVAEAPEHSRLIPSAVKKQVGSEMAAAASRAAQETTSTSITSFRTRRVGRRSLPRTSSSCAPAIISRRGTGYSDVTARGASVGWNPHRASFRLPHTSIPEKGLATRWRNSTGEKVP